MAELSAPLVITVYGSPAPQGSKSIGRAGGKADGKPILVESSKAVKPWREAVAAAAVAARPAGTPPLDGPLSVHVTFMLARPKGHYGTGRNAGKLKLSAPAWPAVMPDLDKLLRSTLDGLTTARAWHDDGQVTRVLAAKTYAARDAIPGAVIEIRQMGARQ